MTDRLLISQGEAARQLGVSRLTLIAEIERGRLRYVLVGKRRKFKPEDLNRTLNDRGGDATKRSLVTRRPGSPNWYENFTVNGHRFRGSLETDDRDQAEIIAAKKRSDALLGKLTGKKPELTLSQALGDTSSSTASICRRPDDIRRMGKVLIADLGKHKPAAARSPADLATYAARRRATLSNRSVNVEIEHLRAVMRRRAATLWGVETPTINWQSLLLEEAGEREHVLSRGGGEAVRGPPPDYHAMVRFALSPDCGSAMSSA
jgi:excisionase family DNA binding protein